jgi:hypothetical protein
MKQCPDAELKKTQEVEEDGAAETEDSHHTSKKNRRRKLSSKGQTLIFRT